MWADAGTSWYFWRTTDVCYCLFFQNKALIIRYHINTVTSLKLCGISERVLIICEDYLLKHGLLSTCFLHLSRRNIPSDLRIKSSRGLNTAAVVVQSASPTALQSKWWRTGPETRLRTTDLELKFHLSESLILLTVLLTTSSVSWDLVASAHKNKCRMLSVYQLVGAWSKSTEAQMSQIDWSRPFFFKDENFIGAK